MPSLLHKSGRGYRKGTWKGDLADILAMLLVVVDMDWTDIHAVQMLCLRFEQAISKLIADQAYCDNGIDGQEAIKPTEAWG